MTAIARATTLSLALPSLLLISSSSTAGAPAPTCFGRTATIVVDGSDGLITGTPKADVIVSTARSASGLIIRTRGGNDRICTDRNYQLVEGEGGNDYIETGRSSFDELVGGAGNDLLRGGPGRDTFYPGTGRDTVDGQESSGDTVDYEGSRNPIDLNLAKGIARGNGRDRLISVEDAEGTHEGDRLVGDGRSNDLLGFRGDDLILGRAGDFGETLGGGTGDDRIVGGRGGDHVIGGEGHDRLTLGAPGESRLGRLQRADGREGDDALVGGPGADFLDGGSGRDSGFGRRGNDRCAGIEKRESCRRAPSS